MFSDPGMGVLLLVGSGLFFIFGRISKREDPITRAASFFFLVPLALALIILLNVGVQMTIGRR